MGEAEPLVVSVTHRTQLLFERWAAVVVETRKKIKDMGKREKKQRHQQRNPHRGASYYAAEQDDDYDYQLSLPSSSYSSDSKPAVPEEEEEEGEEGEEQEQEQEDDKNEENPSKNMPSKFDLYQQSVQVWLIHYFFQYPVLFSEKNVGNLG